MIISALNQVRDAANFAATSAVGFVSDSANFCGRTFENMTESVLPATAAKIVQKVAYGAPFAAAALFVPAYLQLSAFVVYHMVHIVHDIAGQAGELPLNRAIYQNLFTGLATAHLYRAAVETVNLATQQKANIVSIFVNLVFASLFASKAIESPAVTFGSAGVAPKAAVEVPVETSTPVAAVQV